MSVPVQSSIRTRRRRPTQSPISLLPIEIINEIISLRWQDSCPPSRIIQPDSDDPAVPHPYLHESSALILSQVCRLWRQVAHASKQIWSCIFLDDEDLAWSCKRYKGYLRTYLHRSGNHPLSIRISGGATFWLEAQLLSKLLKHASRWHRLECPPAVLQYNSLRASSLPQLHSLYIQSGPHSTTDQFHPAFPIVPSLRTVVVENREYISCLPLPWAQFSSFTGPIQKWQTDTHILSLCNNVRDLTLHCFNSLSSSIILPEVRHVRLIFRTTGQAMFSTLGFLTFPQMKSLAIRGGWCDPLSGSLFVVLHSLLRRIQSPLSFTHLSLSDFPLKTSELILIFTTLPHLTHLKVSNCDASLFQHLVIHHDLNMPSVSDSTLTPLTPVLLPRLTHFHPGGYFTKEDIQSLLACVKSRLKTGAESGHARLNSLWVPLHGWKDFPEQDKATLNSLQNYGLDLCISPT